MNRRVAVALQLGPLMRQQRVLDRELVEAELLLHAGAGAPRPARRGRATRTTSGCLRASLMSGDRRRRRPCAPWRRRRSSTTLRASVGGVHGGSPAPTVPTRGRSCQRNAACYPAPAHDGRLPGGRGRGGPAGGRAPPRPPRRPPAASAPSRSPINLVTEIDRQAEALVVETLHARFPDHSDPRRGGRRPDALDHPSLDHRPAGRHHQLRPRAAALLGLDRPRDRGPRGGGRRLRPEPRRVLRRRAGGRAPSWGPPPRRLHHGPPGREPARHRLPL